MIQSSDNITLPDNSEIIFKRPDIVVRALMYENDYHVVAVRVYEYQTENLLRQWEHPFTTAELTAFTASGTNDVEKYYNLIEQAVVDLLETQNPTVTFTIV